MNIENKKIPECVGFVMDGNRRWAKGHHLETLEGHKIGLQDVFMDMIDTTRNLNIKHGVFYAFSTENWNRSKREVSYLMKLFQETLNELIEKAEETQKDRVRIRVVGDRSRFSNTIQNLISELEEKTEIYTTTTIWLALSYGGRAEIVAATNKAIENGDKVDEKTFKELMWTAGMPDPDLIIRTGGERRISNFLLWQLAYSEFFFTDTLWPDFGEEEFKSMLKEYEGRQRRKGK